jgi:hypothetical protein
VNIWPLLQGHCLCMWDHYGWISHSYLVQCLIVIRRYASLSVMHSVWFPHILSPVFDCDKNICFTESDQWWCIQSDFLTYSVQCLIVIRRSASLSVINGHAFSLISSGLTDVTGLPTVLDKIWKIDPVASCYWDQLIGMSSNIHICHVGSMQVHLLYQLHLYTFTMFTF